MSAQLVSLSAKQDAVASALDALVESGIACRDMQQGFRKAILTALCVEQLKAALTSEVMQPLSVFGRIRIVREGTRSMWCERLSSRL